MASSLALHPSSPREILQVTASADDARPGWTGRVSRRYEWVGSGVTG
jgi:hypothetical protein